MGLAPSPRRGAGQPPRPSALTDQLNQEILRFVRLLKTSARREAGAREAGADVSALHLLWPLLHDGPMRLGDLAEAKGADASTVSRQAAALVRAGLVRREPDPADRRACLLEVTDQGRQACQRMAEHRRREVAEALRGWSAERVGTFTALLREFNQAVEAHHQATCRPAVPVPASEHALAPEETV
ncbi:MAG TPA: MarR family transcriptional regulator [Micromonosporaceae bacterium]